MAVEIDQFFAYLLVWDPMAFLLELMKNCCLPADCEFS